MTNPISSPLPGQSSAQGRGQPADAGKRVLRFSDGPSRFVDPDLYFAKGLGQRLTNNSELSNAIIAAFTMSVATAVTAAAAKSGAQSRAT